jgi:hypothetical protein
MAGKPKQSPLVAAVERINKVGKGGGTTESSLALLNELGLKNGEWCFASKAVLERMMEWYEHAPLFIRVLACIQLHTLGYLPSSGGIVGRKAEGGKPTLAIDEQRLGHCKLHGALLAVTQTKTGKRVPIGPNHIRATVNEAAIRAFERQEGREATASERDAVSAPATHVRKVLAHLEDLGICLRTDNDDVPLTTLRETQEGRDKLKTLSGDNKIRVYFYLKPRESKVAQGSTVVLPSELIPQDLKPLYKALQALKLDVDPAAFAFDGDLQATIRADWMPAKRFNKTGMKSCEGDPRALSISSNFSAKFKRERAVVRGLSKPSQP